MIRSLFFDIDGTLVSFKSHQIPSSTIEALSEAKKKGIGVYISTGRPVQWINNLGAIEHLIDGYIAVNGALCFIGDKTICCNHIAKEDVDCIITDAVDLDYPCIVVGKKDIAIYNPKNIVDDIFKRQLNVDIDYTISLEDVLEQEILQISPFIDTNRECELMSRLSSCVSGRWHPAFTDITSKNADKGKGLHILADYLNLDISETMAFGDGGNDVTILREAGIGIAMGNANDIAKEASDYITTSVDDDGVRNALIRFGIL